MVFSIPSILIPSWGLFKYHITKLREQPNEKKLCGITELETFRFLRKFCKKSLGPGDQWRIL